MTDEGSHRPLIRPGASAPIRLTTKPACGAQGVSARRNLGKLRAVALEAPPPANLVSARARGHSESEVAAALGDQLRRGSDCPARPGHVSTERFQATLQPVTAPHHNRCRQTGRREEHQRGCGSRTCRLTPPLPPTPALSRRKRGPVSGRSERQRGVDCRPFYSPPRAAWICRQTSGAMRSGSSSRIRRRNLASRRTRPASRLS